MLNRKGFTLVELMIVVAIIGILAAIAIPNFVSMQYKSKRSEVPTNLKAIKTAEIAYESNFDVFVTATAYPSAPTKTVQQAGHLRGRALPKHAASVWQQICYIYS